MIAKIAGIIGILCGFFGLSRYGVFNAPIWMLPSVYSVGMFMTSKQTKDMITSSPGLFILNVIMFLRYVMAPYSYYSEGHLNTMINSTQYVYEGLFLMLFEEVMVFITLYLTGIKYYNKCLKMDSKKQDIYSYRLKLKNGFVIISATILILTYIAITYKSIGQGLNIFVSGSLTELKDINSQVNDGQGYINIVWQSLCVWLYVYLVMIEKYKYEHGSGKGPFVRVLLYTFAFIILSFLEGTGITRWLTFVTSIASLFCIYHLFPNFRRTALVSLLIPVCALMVYSSLQKNGGYGTSTTDVKKSIDGIFGATILDVYCNGLGNVNTVFKVDNGNYNVGIISIFYDALSSMPVINHFLPNEKKTSVAFHKAVGRNDQIIPMIGQGYLYFGFLFSPILSVISILLLRYYDLKFKYDYSFKKYGYAFAAVWFGSVAMSLNLSITFMWLYIRVIPFLLVLHYSNKFAKKYVISPISTT